MSPADRLQRLVTVAKLEGVGFLEVSVRKSETAPAEVEVPGPQFELGIDVSAKDRRFRTRFRVTAESDDVTIAVEPIAEYSVPEEDGDLLELSLLLEYANEVALMTMIPFAREAIADVTRKVLGSVVLLPVLRRGEVTFDLEIEDASARR